MRKFCRHYGAIEDSLVEALRKAAVLAGDVLAMTAASTAQKAKSERSPISIVGVLNLRLKEGTNMKRALMMTTLVFAASLGLAACDSEDVENTAVDDIDEIVDEDVNNEAYPVGGDLTEDQQANYDAMDRQAVSDEYDRNMADTRTTTSTGGGAAAGSSSSGGSMDSNERSDTTTTSATNGSSDMSSSESAMSSSMPPRSQMTFSYLDRNSDGQLSVAEYAIWALPTNPIPPEPNDALGPHLTQDEINTAGQTFFYFDDDGDTYLSLEEFQDARNSARVR